MRISKIVHHDLPGFKLRLTAVGDEFGDPLECSEETEALGGKCRRVFEGSLNDISFLIA